MRYTTRVILRADQLVSDCTCPYGGTCKHAVAVALAYLNRSEQAASLPVAPANDPRLVLLERQAAAAAEPIVPVAAPAAQPGARASQEPPLQAFLATHTQAELAQRFPEVREALAVRQMLSNNAADQFEAEMPGRIIAVTAEPGWRNRQDGEGHRPDYGPVYEGLKRLLDQGHADAVVRLGEHLLEAGRDAEIIPLCEREAEGGSGYQRAVERLLAAGRKAEAEQWVRTGIAATARQYPGIASALREVLCTLRGEAGDWTMVAALRAEAFFDSPSLAALRAGGGRGASGSGSGGARDRLALPGNRPAAAAGSAQRRWGEHPGPALPETGIPPAERRYPLQFPQLGLLIELAISAGRPAEVLRWYDRRGTVWHTQINDDTVADALAQAYPERAAAIWQGLAEARIAQTSPAAYEEAALFLRKLRRVWAQRGKVVAWRGYAEQLRAANKRKRRLVETLDVLLQERG